MRVLIASDTNSPRVDGVSGFLLNLEPHLKQFNVKIIAPNFGVPLNRFPVTKTKLLRIRFGDFYFSMPSWGTIKAMVAKSDVVFAQSIGPVGGLAILAAHKQKKPVVLYAHVMDWEIAGSAVKKFKTLTRFFVKLVARWLYRKCSQIIVASSRSADLIGSIGVDTPKIVIPLGIDTQKFKPSDKNAAKKKLGLQGKRVVGFVGRLAHEKDLPTLHAAFKEAQKKVPNMKLLVVGTGITNILPEDEDVRLAGPQTNIVPYLQAMDVFVLPSLTETNSLATMEAMACSVPVIVTPVGSIGDYVVEAKNGFFFPRQDVKALTERLISLLSSPATRLKIGRAARETILQDRQFDKTAKEIANVLKDA
ncbi:hypothetical protein CMO91_04095 [Candidatus Woesearchaeota archaeon]|nr:hypothetical protein [Candidatus Woesearchaeota archaeon]